MQRGLVIGLHPNDEGRIKTSAWCRRIVLTGGPGGGKSTLMGERRAADPVAERWLLVDETAPCLFRAGLDGQAKDFQRAVVRLHVAMEDACVEAARPGQMLLCHRGSLDPLAYWLVRGWDEREFFEATEMTCEEHFGRYDCVVHLQATALGAEQHYLRWPDAHRPESVEEARELDRLCTEAWSKHPRYFLIANAGFGWQEKLRTACELLGGIGAPSIRRTPSVLNQPSTQTV